MNTKTLFALLCVLLLCGTACTSMTQWQGQSKSDLINHWGAPSAIRIDTDGGKIYEYKEVNTCTFPGAERLSADPRNSFKFHTYRLFWVNSEGFVYSWKYKTW